MLNLRRDKVRMMYAMAGVIFFLGVVFLIILVSNNFFYENTVYNDFGNEVLDNKTDAPSDCKFRRHIDGICVDVSLAVNPDLVGIMIENHYEARPLSGISMASVVYEAPVEANFTRFLVVYTSDADVSKVGPVRSARPYYLDWVSEYPGMMYMHVGGSPDALDRIKKFDLFDLNEFYWGWYYWRGQDRSAPHNVYTSKELWQKARVDYGDSYETDSDTESWKFEYWDECEDDCTDNITITFAGEVYQPTWQYNSSTMQYERYELGEPVFDPESGDKIVADTLVVQYVSTQVVDAVGRLSMETIGSGDAVIFRNGFKVEGEWCKASQTEKTRFYYLDEDEQPARRSGREIEFKPGKIWVSVVNLMDGVTYM